MAGVSTKIFDTYLCYNFDDGSSAMMLDQSISCSSERYRFAKTWATIMIPIYPIGTSRWHLRSSLEGGGRECEGMSKTDKSGGNSLLRVV